MIGNDDLHALPMSAVSVALGSTGDKVTFFVPYRCEVHSVGALIEGASVHATAAVIAFDKRPLGGSDTNRGVADVGALTKTLSVNQQGKHLYERPATRITLKPGEQVVGEVTTANGDALAATLFVLVRQTPEDPANEVNMVAA